MSDRIDIHTVFDQLCATHSTRQAYIYEPVKHSSHPAEHVTESPPLVEQLLDSVEPSTAAKSGKRATAGSKPSARLEAIDTATQIDIEAAMNVAPRAGSEARTDLSAGV